MQFKHEYFLLETQRHRKAVVREKRVLYVGRALGLMVAEFGKEIFHHALHRGQGGSYDRIIV